MPKRTIFTSALFFKNKDDHFKKPHFKQMGDYLQLNEEDQLPHQSIAHENEEQAMKDEEQPRPILARMKSSAPSRASLLDRLLNQLKNKRLIDKEVEGSEIQLRYGFHPSELHLSPQFFRQHNRWLHEKLYDKETDLIDRESIDVPLNFGLHGSNSSVFEYYHHQIATRREQLADFESQLMQSLSKRYKWRQDAIQKKSRAVFRDSWDIDTNTRMKRFGRHKNKDGSDLSKQQKTQTLSQTKLIACAPHVKSRFHTLDDANRKLTFNPDEGFAIRYEQKFSEMLYETQLTWEPMHLIEYRKDCDDIVITIPEGEELTYASLHIYREFGAPLDAKWDILPEIQSRDGSVRIEPIMYASSIENAPNIPVFVFLRCEDRDDSIEGQEKTAMFHFYVGTTKKDQTTRK